VFPFPTSFYGNDGTKFPKNSWTAIVHNFVIDRAGNNAAPVSEYQLKVAAQRTATFICET
jgi:hypothetical protein